MLLKLFDGFSGDLLDSTNLQHVIIGQLGIENGPVICGVQVGTGCLKAALPYLDLGCGLAEVIEQLFATDSHGQPIIGAVIGAAVESAFR